MGIIQTGQTPLQVGCWIGRLDGRKRLTLEFLLVLFVVLLQLTWLEKVVVVHLEVLDRYPLGHT